MLDVQQEPLSRILTAMMASTRHSVEPSAVPDAQPVLNVSDWVSHTDASGRAFLVNKLTNQTKWLWNKWALSGKVFCVNAVTNERVWEADMSPQVRMEAGIPPPPPPPPDHYNPSPLHANSLPSTTSRFSSHLDSSDRQIKRQKLNLQQNAVACKPCAASFPSSAEWRAHCNGRAHQMNIMAAGLFGRHNMNMFGAAGGVEVPFSSGGYEPVQKRGPRFSSAPKLSPTFRQVPPPPVPRAIPVRRRDSSFSPQSSRARGMMSCVTMALPKSSSPLNATALLYDRDFAISSDAPGKEKGLTSKGAAGDSGVVAGTCMAVEKMYLRLTSAPNPDDVRPVAVLKRALKLVKKCWKTEMRDYEWVCSQLKSIRQDIQVQHIETTLVLDVYETHALIALENGDFGEFNTCVAQLPKLYQRLGRPVSVQDEFAAYRILYDVLVGENENEHARMLKSTTPENRARPAVKYAMLVRRAVIDGDYEMFFRLYASPPERTKVTFLLDRMVEYVRSRALATMCTAYSPGKLGLAFAMSQLGWGDGSDESSVRDAVAFCEEIGVVLVAAASGPDGSLAIDAKASRSGGVSVVRKRRGLITAAGTQ